jgi:hypothetical protein
MHAGVYEPNVIYRDGKWRMWYVIGPPDAGQKMAHGYAESADGNDWSHKKIYWPAEENIFDYQVVAVRRDDTAEATGSRTAPDNRTAKPASHAHRTRQVRARTR